ncbi:MAG: arsenite efflux transporter metallochaperone ArsD [Candidatus Competibacteraceae bacterium]|jgi:hypothetical protein
MATLQIFDPALCCSTGVCGVEVDQEMARFAADLDWARRNGARIERFNLAQEPMAFVNQPTVRAALERLGQSGLPLTLVNGDLQCSGRYPSRDELATWIGELPAKPAIRQETAALLQRSSAACCAPAATTEASSGNRGGCC